MAQRKGKNLILILNFTLKNIALTFVLSCRKRQPRKNVTKKWFPKDMDAGSSSQDQHAMVVATVSPQDDMVVATVPPQDDMVVATVPPQQSPPKKITPRKKKKRRTTID